MLDVTRIVDNIQRICREKGVTPTVAGRESGAGKDLVTNMKKKGTRPSIEKIRLLADYLNVSVSDILWEDDVVDHQPLTPAEKELMDEFRSLTPEQQEMVLRMVKAAPDRQ